MRFIHIIKTKINVSIKPMDNPDPDNSENKPSFGDISTPVAPQQTNEFNPSPQTPPPVSPNIPQVISNNQKPKKRWPKALALLILIALIAVGGWYFFLRNNQNNTTDNTVAQESKDIPVLKIGAFQADYGDLYPNVSANDYGIAVNAQMFEGLVRYENKSNIEPNLASDWTNPDDNTWIFTIRKNIKFHDGHTLAPSDVKYSLDKASSGDSDLDQTFAGTIKSVSLVGKDQVKITTKTPDPTLLNKLTFLYIIDANLPKGSEPSMGGTGPYQIKPGTKPTNRSYQMVAFDQYHGGRPTTRELVFGSEDSNAALLKAFNEGQFNIIGTIAPDAVKKAHSAKLFTIQEADSTFIGFNTVKASDPVHNKLVREAIRYAVDAEKIGTANDVVITPVSQLTPPSIPGYNPAIPPYKQDIKKAKQLLVKAGYPNGLTISFSVSNANTKESAEISKELKQVGITLKIDRHANLDEFIGYFITGKAEMYTIDYASDTLDGVDIYTTVLPKENYNSPKVTALLDQANMTVDPAKRLKLLQQVATIVDEDVAVVPLGSAGAFWVMDKDYVLQQNMPTGYPPVYFYKVHLN